MSRKALVGEEESEEGAPDGGVQVQEQAVTMDAGDLAMQREAVREYKQAAVHEGLVTTSQLTFVRSVPRDPRTMPVTHQ